MRADPNRVRLAAEALARARADAWARGDRPQGLGKTGKVPAGFPSQPAPGLPRTPSASTERSGVTLDAALFASGLARPNADLARPRREDPQPLDAALGGLLSNRGWRQRAAIGGVFARWTEIVGPQLAAHAKPDGFADTDLIVTADSTAWATQVRLLAPQILKRLAEEVGAGTIQRIVVRGPGTRGRNTLG